MDYSLQGINCSLSVYERGNKNSSIMLIVLHGGPGSGAKALIELSAFQTLEKDVHCIYFDQRGSGSSIYDLRKGLTRQCLCEDVHAVIQDSKERWEHKHIVLWGGSFGGYLACLYMEKYGDVDALILSSPAITFSREQALDLFHRNRAMMENRLPNTKQKRSFEHEDTVPEDVFKNQSFIDYVYSTMNPSNSLRHMTAMSSWFYHYNASNTLKQLNVPTLLMIGKEDPICDASCMMLKLKDIHNPNIKVRCLTPCGHAVFEDREKDFIHHIHEFLMLSL